MSFQPSRSGAMAGSVGAASTPPFWPAVLAAHAFVLGAWHHDLLRLVILTLYYLAIIAALVVLYGGNEYVPPPFVYQGF